MLNDDSTVHQNVVCRHSSAATIFTRSVLLKRGNRVTGLLRAKCPSKKCRKEVHAGRRQQPDHWAATWGRPVIDELTPILNTSVHSTDTRSALFIGYFSHCGQPRFQEPSKWTAPRASHVCHRNYTLLLLSRGPCLCPATHRCVYRSIARPNQQLPVSTHTMWRCASPKQCPANPVESGKPNL